jgi:molecular chaperone GrpE
MIEPENETSEPTTPETGAVEEVLFADEDDDNLTSTTTAEDPIVSELQRVTAERNELKDQILRRAADMENMRRRHQREKDDFQKLAAEKVLRDMVSLMDDLDRAMEAGHLAAEQQQGSSDSLTGLLQGVGMVQRKFAQTLERHGVSAVTALGQVFDPHLHEAIQQKEDPSVPRNTVIQEFQKAYRLGDRLLRPAMVVVAVGGPDRVIEAAEPTGNA